MHHQKRAIFYHQRIKHWAKKHMPILQWLPQYNIQRDLKFDIIAGITVAMMIIPQEVSLASIMGVDPVYGLYTAAVVPMIYPIFGTSRVLSVANAAEVSLLVGAALESIEDKEERVATGILLSLYSGIIMTTMGLFHLGMVVDFFSRPVMGGYVSAGGILIMLSQVKHLFGVSYESSEFAIVTLIRLFSNVNSTNVAALTLGLFSIFLLAFLKYAKNHLLPSVSLRNVFVEEDQAIIVEEQQQHPVEYQEVDTPTLVNPTQVNWSFSLNDSDFLSLEQMRRGKNDTAAAVLVENHLTIEPVVEEQPEIRKTRAICFFIARLVCDLGALFVCVIGIAAGYVLDELYDFDIALTGAVPSGFPSPKVPWYGLLSSNDEGRRQLIAFENFSKISVNAFVIAIIAYMSSIAMAKRLAIKDGYEVNPNQELLGIGIGSIVGSFFQSMPPTGAMSRTAVNAQNAKTQLASIITACIVIIALHWLTGPLFYLPKATLAAIIIVAAYSLIELEEATWLFKVKRDEFYVWLASFGLTVALGVLPGLVASIAASLLAIMYRTKRPPVTRLGERCTEEGISTYVDVELFEDAVVMDEIEILRVEGSLYFANCEYVQREIESIVFKKQEDLKAGRVKGVIIDACSINDWDATAIQVMEELLRTLSAQRIMLVMANVRVNLSVALEASNFSSQLIQSNETSISIDQAIRLIMDHEDKK